MRLVVEALRLFEILATHHAKDRLAGFPQNSYGTMADYLYGQHPRTHFTTLDRLEGSITRQQVLLPSWLAMQMAMRATYWFGFWSFSAAGSTHRRTVLYGQRTDRGCGYLGRRIHDLPSDLESPPPTA
jgi:hypothetical protein